MIRSHRVLRCYPAPRTVDNTTTAPALLRMTSLVKTFGDIHALRGVDLHVRRGEVVCIIGPSGCGKSTLLRCANWLEQPDEGSVILDGEYIGRKPVGDGRIRPQTSDALNRMRSRIGMVYQQFNVWPHLCVLENVTRAQIVVLKRTPQFAVTRARELLAQVGLTEKEAEFPDRLSGGQLQRVAIARALAMDPKILLLDEPTSALDPELVGDVLGVLRDLTASGMTMMIVTHELGFARHAADTLVFMDRGEIVERGEPDNLLANPQSERLREFLQQLDFLHGSAQPPAIPVAISTAH